jgi:hypothetical protein
MNAFTISVILWGCVTAAFTALMIYHGYLAQHESDHLYLSDTEPSNDRIENESFIRRDDSIRPLLRGVGGAAVLLTLIVAGIWVSNVVAGAHLL